MRQLGPMVGPAVLRRAAARSIGVWRRLRAGSRWRRDRAILAETPLFDAEWYGRTYPEVAAAGWDPLDHYLAYGRAGLTSPGPAFDAPAYLAANPDIAADGLNPLLHYIEHGRRERRPMYPGQRAVAV